MEFTARQLMLKAIKHNKTFRPNALFDINTESDDLKETTVKEASEVLGKRHKRTWKQGFKICNDEISLIIIILY
jgi:hypothetical protein